ncbi:uncharacterized protein LOC119688547 [Teleopsis dalmanni]|uniref:uncharacterized protein LOC119688547 n=1 Tax=Teleopsis dalmanni TaxID=139649 RepID=UPI0018CCBA0C|nr:uncharacterized protein LOC119688547 [Teleopsis dalmanni]
MGILPDIRVQQAHPFMNTGVDYAGPFKFKCFKGRGLKTFKGYVAVFVCLATKAIHLEAVGDLSLETFLAALKRFFSRRGKSKNIYSDNGINFAGAANILGRDIKAAAKSNNKLAPILASEGVQWHFIPPAAPRFGGIWVAGVKSLKYHLK